MTTDIVLTVLNAVWGVILIGIGFEMVHIPPDTPTKKMMYRILFGIFGSAVIVTTLAQSIHNSRGSQETSRATNQQQLNNQTQLSYVHGQLDTISKFEADYIAHPPKTASELDISAAMAILRMAQNSRSPMAVPPVSTDAKEAIKKHISQLIDEATPILRKCADVSPPDKGGLAARICLDAGRDWINEVKGYLSGSLGHGYDGRFATIPSSPNRVTGLDATTSEYKELDALVRSVETKQKVLHQIILEISD
jgi:hypothetical protein